MSNRHLDNAYRVLRKWLSCADQHYLGGRFLCRSGAPFVAGSVLWLAAELQVKVLVLQKIIPSLQLPKHTPANRNQEISELASLLDKKAKRICKSHSAKKLLQELQKHYPTLDVSLYLPIIDQLEDFYFMRYPVYGSRKFSSNEVMEIDGLYFMLRDNVLLDVGMGSLDILYLYHVNDKPIITRVELDAFEDNKAIRPRLGCAKHPKFTMGWHTLEVSETLHFP